jgi:hypothetical protein
MRLSKMAVKLLSFFSLILAHFALLKHREVITLDTPGIRASLRDIHQALSLLYCKISIACLLYLQGARAGISQLIFFTPAISLPYDLFNGRVECRLKIQHIINGKISWPSIAVIADFFTLLSKWLSKWLSHLVTNKTIQKNK